MPSPATTAAGFVFGTVERRQARYKLEGRASQNNIVKQWRPYPRRTFTSVFTWTGGAVACSFLTLASSRTAAR
jgi:hypothetical protein